MLDFKKVWNISVIKLEIIVIMIPLDVSFSCMNMIIFLTGCNKELNDRKEHK